MKLNTSDSKGQSHQTDRKKPYRHGRDVFHAWMLEGATYAGPLDMPVLKPVQATPNHLVAFADAMSIKWTDFDCWVHFFDDDYRIECFWNNPKAYISKLSKFKGVIGLDYSVCWDFPVAEKYHNHFRNSTCTYWLQQQMAAVPQARCEGYDGDEVLAGFPKHSSIAIGARSMVRNKKDREILKRSVRYVVDELEPTNLIWYGSNKYGVADYSLLKGIPVIFYPAKGRGKLGNLDSGS